MMKRYTHYVTFIFKKLSLIMPMVKRTFVQKNIVHPTKSSIFFHSSVLALILLMVGVESVSAVPYTATQSGYWNAASTWGGAGVPTAADDVNIGNYTITLTADAACTNFTSGSYWGLVLGANNLSVSGSFTFGCSVGSITATTGYIILNGTSQTINLCTGGGANNSIPNLRLTNSTAVTIVPQGNLTITGNFDCQTGSSTFSNNDYAGWPSGTFKITGTCTAPNCTFIAGTNINGTSMDFSSSTSNPIQVGGVIDNQSNSTITFGSKNVTTTTAFSGTYVNKIIATGTVTVLTQTFLLDPAGAGGFELGNTFALNGWTVVNNGTNAWAVGPLVKYAGVNGAYVSNDGGTTNSYSSNSYQTSHFYRDIAFPKGQNVIKLSFFLKGNGEQNFDRLLVYVAPTTVTPTAGSPTNWSTTMTGATLVYSQTTLYGSFTDVNTIYLPSSLAGTTSRLIFTWQNDDNTGVNPPAAIDNISLTSEAGAYITTTGASNFTIPNGVSCVKVEAWGGGGKGSNCSTNGYGGGGGGGAYASNFFSVTSGSPYSLYVGAGSTTTAAGGDSYFINNLTLLAKGGNSAANNTQNGALGGSSTSVNGSITNGGGNGGTYSVSSNGGGSSGGPGGAGITPTQVTGGSSPAGGGTGGNSSYPTQGNGYPGYFPGGGGGGGYKTSGGATYTGGAGANGLIVITWGIDVSNFATTAVTPVGQGNVSTVTVSSSSLRNATYTVTYNLSGANTATGNTATMAFTAGTGNFQTSSLMNIGTTTLTITSLSTTGWTCGSVVSTGNTANIVTGSNIWNGTNSTAWGIDSNWSLGVPASGADVTFAANPTNNLILDANLNCTIGNLTNMSNKQLIVPPATSLIVNNTITTGNDPSRILIQSAPNQPNGSFIFQSTTAYATVQMYSKVSAVGGNYNWQYFGIPIAEATPTTYSPTFDGAFVRRNDEKIQDYNGKWLSIPNSYVLKPFIGYEITKEAPTTILFSGQLVNTNGSIPLTYTYSSTAYDPGQNLLANPYTAAIDITKIGFGPNTEKTVYLYNTGSYNDWSTNNGETTNTNSTTQAGQYLAIPQSLAGTVVGTIVIPKDIPSMSGFLVKVIGTTFDTTDNLTISYSSVINNVNPQRAPQSKDSSDKQYMQISLKGEHSGDIMWLINEPGTTHGFDNGWDGTKLSGAAGRPQLFAMEPSGNYQISTSDDLNNTYLGFQTGVDLEDTLTFNNENLELKYDGVYLVDLVENKVVDITKSGTQYAFKAESTVAPVKRFKITTEPYVKGASDLASQLKVFNDNNAVFVDNQSNEKGELYFYDIMGRYLKKEIFGPNSISSFSVITKSGAYVVKAVTASEKVSKRIIVNYQGE